MSELVGATNAKVQIEIEGRTVVFALDRPSDCLLIRWQDAFALADVLNQAIEDVRDEMDIVDFETLQREQAQLRIGHHRDLVALIFEHGTRLHFSWRAAVVVRDALRIKAQDAQLAERGLHLHYNRRGHLRTVR